MAKKQETVKEASKEPVKTVAKSYEMKPLKDCEEITIKSDFGAFKKGEKRRLHDSMIDLLKANNAL